MKRTEVKSEYKWNLDDIFFNLSEWEKEYSALNKDIVSVLKYKDRLNHKDNAVKCLQLIDSLSERIERQYVYAMLLNDENLKDNKSTELKARAENLYVQYGTITSFVTPELSALDDKQILEYIEDSDFKSYDYMLKTVLKNKKHILPQGEEKILAMGQNTFSSFSNIFSKINNIELPFPTLNVDGKKVKLTHGTYSLFLQHRDKAVRKKAFKAMYKAVGSLIHTVAANYSASVIKDNYLAEVRRYPSAIEKSLCANDVPVAVYDKLIEMTNLNLGKVHKYIEHRQKVLGEETLNMYDLYVPIYNADLKLEFDEAYEMMLDGLKPMGGEYIELLKTARDKRWIDVCETENKRSGAYSCSVTGVHPYVLLNHNLTTHSIFTIAHEMGHALHSYYSNKNQPYAKADYSIFVAEIASTVNEVLLIKYLLNQTKDPVLKKYLLSYYLDMFRTTLFRQTMFAEFEKAAHDMEKSGKPLTVDTLNNVYYKLNKKYYGPQVKHDKEIKMEWARIPHFYHAFYVYQYSTGIISAVKIASDILNGKEGAVERYKTFLSSGGCKSPYEILKDCGVDLKENAPYDAAFKEFGEALNELMH